MITKEQLLQSMRHEVKVIKHLATKVPPDRLDFRPTPGQRSTLELLRYMTTMAIVPGLAAVKGDWDHAEALESESENVTLETFPDAMDRQMTALAALLERVDPDTSTTTPATLPWGTPTALGPALVDMVLKPLVAYRMQLFLYAKQSGAPSLGAANCWVGVDPRRSPVS